MPPDVPIIDSAPADPLGGGWVRPVSGRDRRLDVVLAGMLLAAMAITIPLYSADGRTQVPALPLTVVWALLMTGPLALRRRFPGTVAALSAGVFVAGQIAQVPEEFVGQIALVVAVYTVGAWSADHRRSRIVLGAILVEVSLWSAIGIALGAGRAPADPRGLGPTVALAVLQTVLVFGATVGLGETSWLAARRLAALRRSTAELVAERERTAAQAVTLDRMRIARELHDVVAHHVSVMGLQAAAARRVLRTAPDRAAEALGIVEDNARVAVDELHGMLVSLRTDDGPADPPSSTLGLQALPELVAAARRSGTPTTLTVEGDPDRLSPVTGITIYRIVQEALTNIRKHAGAGAAAAVQVRIGVDEVTLHIADRGGSPGPTPSSQGLGLIGMRERLAAVGGSLAAGEEGGGYVVRAAVPVGPAR